jgi:hexokinase
MDVDHVSEGCAEIVQWACKMVASRAAALAACAIAAVVLHTGNDKVPEGENDTGVDVGLDGRWVSD